MPTPRRADPGARNVNDDRRKAMRTHTVAFLAALLLLLGLGAGTAAADSPTQAALQQAASQQSASSDANATQVNPTNRNVSVRIGSAGDNGNVTQTNAAAALALAGNANQTSQSATQTQSGAGTQAAGQAAANAQDATANAGATQVKPSNDNVSVRIHSPGDDGDVQQTNAAAAGAAAGNANGTAQSAGQSQSGGGGDQAVEQAASNEQAADAKADAKQIKPSNENISVRIGSAGDNGKVTQTNAALAGALAGNANETTQSADQSQGGGDAAKCGCGHGGDGVQAVGQFADSHQSADADADAKQIKPTNDNTSVRIDSPGNDGDVSQSNVAGALGVAFNANATEQSVDQSQGGGSSAAKCGCYGGGSGVQAVGQFADSYQSADADAEAKQIDPTNANVPVRIGSSGGGGNVTQSNAALSGALAGNLNYTSQSTSQSQADGGGVQAVDQEAANWQSADADADTFQVGATNLNAPVDIGYGGHDKGSKQCGCDDGHGGYGDSSGYGGHGMGSEQCGCDDGHGGYGGSGGDVSQSNVAGALGVAFNANATEQSVDQSQGGGSSAAKCGCYGGGSGVQAVGQFADSYQSADADAEAKQIDPTNANVPVRIGSSGGGGNVTQSNAALSGALAGNLNYTSQSTSQSQADGGGVQAVDQEAANWQSADADADTFQVGATNLNAPVDIGYGGHDKGSKQCGCDDGHGGYGGSGGDVTQSNLAGAFSKALNANATEQSVNQSQGGYDAKQCGCDHGGYEKPGYDKGAYDKGGYDKPGSDKGGYDKGGYDKGGYDDAKCGCSHGGGGVQAVGQFASNHQAADSKAHAKQLWPTNENTPVRIGSAGGGGSVYQTNAALAYSLAANLNLTRQEVDQTQ
jgi:hypothetical protein